ncbi:MAG: polysaccharide deacetylase family protein, partial [Planctomycetes bacterium]|nr:polysaccharide deacetylase family protein [Planctomycetota bacterium]
MIDIKNPVQARRRRGKGSAGGQGLILLYHRVCSLDSDPLLLCVSPGHFAEHLDILRRQYHPISLRELVDAIRDDAVPRDSVVVTFDDGYLDNLEQAKPLLERFDIPATVFVASGYVGGQREFWWDELDRLLLQAGDLPKSLRVRINGTVCEQFMGEDALDSAASLRKRRAWNVEQDDLSLREGLFRRLQTELRTLDDACRQRVLSELITWAGTKPEPRGSHRAMSTDDLLELTAGGLVEVGGHTVTHPVLSTLRRSAQRDEIASGKTKL